MTDSIFLLRCVDCDALGLLSRLWLRASVEVKKGRPGEVQRYVECMNCGAHLKSRHHDRMESVGDEEWRRFVDEDVQTPRGSAPSAS
jgi:hypothetical protein